ncbi:MAG: hypothetical protein GY810_11340 [Aureispira sp.]|nr:hypothetical protein [Aureispira sp.]
MNNILKATLLILITLCFKSNLDAQNNNTSIEGIWTYNTNSPVNKNIDQHFLCIENNLMQIVANETNFAPITSYSISNKNTIKFHSETAKRGQLHKSGSKSLISSLFGEIKYKLNGDQLIFTQGKRKLTLTRYNQEVPKELLGSWTYNLKIYRLDNGRKYGAPLSANEKASIKNAMFSITIDKNGMHWGGNLVECNSCWKAFQVIDNHIIYLDRTSSAICTEKKCLREYELCEKENKEKLISPFHDMNFELDGDTLILKSKMGTLTLTRHKVE